MLQNNIQSDFSIQFKLTLTFSRFENKINVFGLIEQQIKLIEN